MQVRCGAAAVFTTKQSSVWGAISAPEEEEEEEEELRAAAPAPGRGADTPHVRSHRNVAFSFIFWGGDVE